MDCMVALPGQLFYSTQIPACLWFLSRNRRNGKYRDRRSEILFIDARKLGLMVDRTHRDFAQEDIARIASAYHAWRGEEGAGDYEDVPGFCKSASLEEIRKHGYILTPGRYVGAEAPEDDGEPFEDKMKRLVTKLRAQQAEATRLDEAIITNLIELGMLSDATCPFAALFAEPTRNGLMRPKAVRGSGVKMVNMGEIFAHPRLKNVAMERVPVDQSDRSRFLLQDGDLLFARQSLVLTGAGKCSIFLGDNEPATFESHIIRVRLNQAKANPLYYYYYFQSHEGRAAIQSIVEQGAGASGIRATDLAAIDVAWCPITVQDAIAHILGTLDDKIELNRRMNETLEEMTRTLFKSWFVDFDPVRAKMEGRDTGLPPDVADLFPDRLVDSELGEIPEGWEVIPLPEMIEVNPPRSLRKGEVAPYLDMANMPTRGHVPDTVIDRPFGSGMRFTNGDTLVARITPCLENGKTAYVDFLPHDRIGWGSTEYIVMRPMPPLPNEFAYCLARSTDFREFAIQNMTGTSGRQRVPAQALSQFLLPSPPESIAVRFGKVVQPLFTRASEAVRESRTLAVLRDTLLPKLVSGESRVEDAEEWVETIA